MSTLAGENEHLETKNELELIMNRGAADYSKDFSSPEDVAAFDTEYICQEHRKELSTGWNRHHYSHFIRTKGPPERTKCSYPDDRHGEDRPLIPLKKGKTAISVTREEAESVLALEGIHLHVGLRTFLQFDY